MANFKQINYLIYLTMIYLIFFKTPSNIKLSEKVLNISNVEICSYSYIM